MESHLQWVDLTDGFLGGTVEQREAKLHEEPIQTARNVVDH